MRRLVVVVVAVVTVLCACAGLGSNRGIPGWMRGWNDPFPAFRVAGNIHYVGTNRMALFLITTPAGHILLDTGFEAKVPQLQASVASLGFRFEDIEIILASHAHIDHVQAHARVRELTGARVLASRADAAVISTGGKHEWMYGDEYAWTPCPVDGIIEDGQKVELGGTTLTAHLTPGHSRGATTFTMTVADDDGRGGKRPLSVVFFPSAGVPAGVRVVGNPAFPEAVAAFESSFARWKKMPADVFLGAHGNFFDLEPKYERLRKGAIPSPFIDPAAFPKAIAEAESKFRATVAKQGS